MEGLMLEDGRFGARVQQPLVVGEFRELTETEVLALQSAEPGSKGSSPPSLKSLRERHHTVAIMLAEGQKPVDVARFTGYSISRISILQKDPAFKDLLAHYRGIAGGAFADHQSMLSSLSADAIAVLHDRLEDDPEAIGTSTLIDIVKTAADRAGHGPQTKSTNVNIHMGIGEKLAKAQARRREKVIDHGEVADTTGSDTSGTGSGTDNRSLSKPREGGSE